jgi:hypothetical protein
MAVTGWVTGAAAAAALLAWRVWLAWQHPYRRGGRLRWDARLLRKITGKDGGGG